MKDKKMKKISEDEIIKYVINFLKNSTIIGEYQNIEIIDMYLTIVTFKNMKMDNNPIQHVILQDKEYQLAIPTSLVPGEFLHAVKGDKFMMKFNENAQVYEISKSGYTFFKIAS